MKSLKKFTENTSISLTNENRLKYLFYVGSVGLLFSLLMSASAWSTGRTFPFSPVIPNFVLPTLIQTGLFTSVIIGLTVSLFYPNHKKTALTVSLLSLLLLVLTDITRLQPWILHYSAVLVMLSFLIPKKHFSTTHVLDAARLVVGGIYFYAGIQKLNLRFFTEIFPWVTQNIWEPFGENGIKIALLIGLFIPFIEALFAIGFFTKRFRNLSIVGSTSMIILVLASLGPWAQNWNSSVWPWNFGIYGMVLILFLGADFSLLEFIKRQKKNLLVWLAVSIFWIMPLGNFIGITDHYLSWSLYSGRVPEASLIGDQLFLESLSSRAENGSLPFQRWTISDLNLVPYPEERVFKNVFNELCNKHEILPAQLVITTPHFFQTNLIDKETFNCSDL